MSARTLCPFGRVRYPVLQRFRDAADGKIDWADPKWARGKLDDMLAGTYEPQKLRAPVPGGYQDDSYTPVDDPELP